MFNSVCTWLHFIHLFEYFKFAKKQSSRFGKFIFRGIFCCLLALTTTAKFSSQSRPPGFAFSNKGRESARDCQALRELLVIKTLQWKFHSWKCLSLISPVGLYPGISPWAFMQGGLICGVIGYIIKIANKFPNLKKKWMTRRKGYFLLAFRVSGREKISWDKLWSKVKLPRLTSSGLFTCNNCVSV